MGSISAIEPRLAPQFTRHVRELYSALEEHLAAADAARDLLAHPGWAHLDRLLNAEIDTIDAELDSGRPLESRAEYAAAHGRRGGLKAPEQALLALISRAESRLHEQRAKHEGSAESLPDGSST